MQNSLYVFLTSDFNRRDCLDATRILFLYHHHHGADCNLPQERTIVPPTSTTATIPTTPMPLVTPAAASKTKTAMEWAKRLLWESGTETMNPYGSRELRNLYLLPMVLFLPRAALSSTGIKPPQICHTVFYYDTDQTPRTRHYETG